MVWLYEAQLLVPSLYECSEFVGYEDDGTPFRVLWKPVQDFYEGAVLYPNGLLAHLQSKFLGSGSE